MPTILFFSDDQRELTIDAVNMKGFNINYSNFATNQHSDFYISNDIEKSNWATEEIIEFFFDNTLESQIKLKPIPSPLKNQPIEVKEKKSPKNIEFNFNPKHFKTMGWLTFLWLGLFIAFYLIDNKRDFPLIMYVLLTLTWFPTFVFHLTYFIKNRSAKVIIDTKNHDLMYIKGPKEIKFNRDDIFRCQITTAASRVSWGNYSYVWFI